MLCISCIPRAAAGYLRALPVPGSGISLPPGFLTDTWFLTRNTNMEDFIGKTNSLSQMAMSLKDWTKIILEVCKGIFPRFYVFSHLYTVA